jgi:hypothetical protein
VLSAHILIKNSDEARRMDLNPKILHSFPSQIPLPFYMTYPGYLGAETEREILKDMEYLQQVYPGEVKRYQRRVAEILDKMDYEGSMIYDEYPDFGSLRRMVDSIMKILQNEEDGLPEEQRTPAEKWNWLADMIQVLLCDEIYKRRHGGRRGKNFWMN